VRANNFKKKFFSSHSITKSEVKDHILMVSTVAAAAVMIDYDDNIKLQPKKRHVL
jgi:hypothetical protein